MVADGVRNTLAQYGQEHLLQFWDHLSDKEQESLLSQINSINFDEIQSYFTNAQQTLTDAAVQMDDLMEPLEPDVQGSVARSTSELLKNYEAEGLARIAAGEVAVLLLAGGQGTRLGVDYPKGMYNVGLPSRKCLYQLQGERVFRIQELAAKEFGKAGTVPWYIMTSEATKEKTSEYFSKKNFFGLKKENVIFFEQNTLPCLTFDGKIILEAKARISKAPDGNGGLYRALNDSKVLDDMEHRGIKYIHVYCVDNILIKMADPTFIGFCVQKNVQCGAKVVEKTVPTEAVGVACKVKGRYQVVEYSEITLKTAQMRNADGRLKYNAGNICNHFFTVDFLKDIVQGYDHRLIHHVAKKKIPYVGSDGEVVNPIKPNGIKMEKFVFDVFPFAERFCTWEVLREDEFSALKNADGASECTPTTARHSLYNLHYRYILNAGGHFGDAAGVSIPEIRGESPASVSGDQATQPNLTPPIDESRRPNMPNGNGTGESGESSTSSDEEVQKLVVVEISPLVSYAGEGLEDLVQGKFFASPLIISSAKEAVGKSRVRKPSFVVD